MNLRQLTYFLAVVDTGSFTEAATRVHVAQPSLSQQIKALEAELGGQLIERLPRKIKLTSAGRAFLPAARIAVESAEQAAAAAQRALRFETGELEIATVRSLAVAVLPRSIQHWHRLHPEILIRLHEYAHSKLVEQAVLEGIGEIGVGPPPTRWSGAVEPLGWDELLVLIPPSDPLAGVPDPVQLATLADRDWVLFERPHGLAPLIDAACNRAGFRPRGVVETAQVDAAARLAAAGLGVALVPANTVPGDLVDAVRRLDPPVVWRVSAFTVGQWSALTGAYLETLRDASLLRRRPRNAWVVNPGESSSLAR